MSRAARALGLAFALLAAADAVHAGVYRCKDAKGATVFSDKPCAGAQDLSTRYAAPQARPEAQTPEQRYPMLDPERGDPALIGMVMQRRALYVREGLDPTAALDRAVQDFVPDAQPAGPPTGADRTREFVEQRQREQAERAVRQDAWRAEQDGLDQARAEREREAQAQRAAYNACEDERRAREREGLGPRQDCSALRPR